MSTIITILIIAIIAALVIVGLKETIKHSKGEGAHRRNALHELQELSHTLASEDERSIGRCGFKAWRGTC